MIIFIIIVVAFVNKAGELGLNKFLWGFVGLAAYMGTQMLIGLMAGLFMDIESLALDRTNELALNFAGIIFGGVAAFAAYKSMPSYAMRQPSDQTDLLDEDMFR